MRKLQVSEPSLNNFEQFTELAKEVWDSGILTHNGPKVQLLESNLKDKFNIPNLSLVTNGTVALEIAIRALELPKGSEIITTPFTWIATASSILWQQYIPVFADINIKTLNIDPNSIRSLVNDKTSAILAVHVFSNPCDVESIDELAKELNLKVIYDGAHSVGVKYKGKDLSLYGDISTHSYHATKLYNCGEGGAVITEDPELAKRVERLRFFGHDDNKNIIHEGTNGKMHEISACIGLANLNLLNISIRYRKDIQLIYKKELAHSSILYQSINPESYNYSYFPIILESKELVNRIIIELDKINVVARRYFSPSLNTMSIFNYTECLNSEYISDRILCLPCHDNVTGDDVVNICSVIKGILC